MQDIYQSNVKYQTKIAYLPLNLIITR